MKKEENDIDKRDLEKKYFKTKKTTSFEISKKNWNRIKRDRVIFAKVTKINYGCFERDKRNLFKD